MPALARPHVCIRCVQCLFTVETRRDGGEQRHDGVIHQYEKEQGIYRPI